MSLIVKFELPTNLKELGASLKKVRTDFREARQHLGDKVHELRLKLPESVRLWVDTIDSIRLEGRHPPTQLLSSSGPRPLILPRQINAQVAHQRLQYEAIPKTPPVASPEELKSRIVVYAAARRENSEDAVKALEPIVPAVFVAPKGNKLTQRL